MTFREHGRVAHDVRAGSLPLRLCAAAGYFRVEVHEDSHRTGWPA